MEIVLNTYGLSLNRDNEAFVITKKDERHRIPVDDVKSIQISRGALISSDAVMLAVEHEIDVMFMDKVGHPVGRIWSPRYGSISTIRKGQLNFSASHAALEWIKEVIMQKMENQQALMLLLQPRDAVHEKERKRNMERIEDYRNKVSKLDGDVVNDVAPTLRGWEGQASRIYFSTIVKYLPEEYQFEQRSQHPATDVANAFLNYGYGVLYGKIDEIIDIQYGKKIRISMGVKQAEINLFFGKRGFSVVKSPRSGTNAELNDLTAQLIQTFIYQL